MFSLTRLFLIALLLAAPAWGADYQLAFSTYLGGPQHRNASNQPIANTGWEHARDIFADAEGNIYVTGGTGANAFPVTEGAYQTTYNPNPDSLPTSYSSFGPCDVFLAKYNASGQLLWCTYFGGPNYDRAYALELDFEGNIIIAGRAGKDMPTTEGVLQPTFNGPEGTNGNGNYGKQNGFVAKFTPEGVLVWCTYVGVGNVCRDVAVDAEGDIYVPLSRISSSPALSAAFTGKMRFRATAPGGIDSGVAKISKDGTEVIWATWMGGTANDSQEAAIRVDAQERPHLLFNTSSNNVPTAGAGADTSYNGSDDLFVARFSADGNTLEVGSYVGGNGKDGQETHGLALDTQGNIFVMGHTASSNLPVTSGVLQSTLNGTSDLILAKLAGNDAVGAPALGSILRMTYIGGSGGEGPDGIYISPSGQVVLAAESNSTDFPTTPNAFQAADTGGSDGIILVVAPDFSALEYCTYLGGSAGDNARCLYLGADGAIYTAGGTLSSDFPLSRAQQTTLQGGSHQYAPNSGDCFVAKFILPHDSDGDGQSDVDEFQHGTQPLSGLSFLNPGIQRQPTQAEVSFPGHKGRYYIFERRVDYGGWGELERSATLSADQPVTFTDSAAPAPEAQYRVTTVFP